MARPTRDLVGWILGSAYDQQATTLMTRDREHMHHNMSGTRFDFGGLT